MKLSKRTIDEAVEVEYVRVERMQMSAADRAELNSIIDEERLREQAADEAYWEQMCEIEDERRNDR